MVGEASSAFDSKRRQLIVDLLPAASDLARQVMTGRWLLQLAKVLSLRKVKVESSRVSADHRRCLRRY
jgi:hypothetical protein